MPIGLSRSNWATRLYRPARTSGSSVLAACLASAVASGSQVNESARNPPQIVVKFRNTAGSCSPPQRAKRKSLDLSWLQLLLNVASSSVLGWTVTPTWRSWPTTAKASDGLSDDDRSIVTVKPVGNPASANSCLAKVGLYSYVGRLGS